MKTANKHLSWINIDTRSLNLRLNDPNKKHLMPAQIRKEYFKDFASVVEEWWSFYEVITSMNRNRVQLIIGTPNRAKQIVMNTKNEVWAGNKKKKFSQDESLYAIMLWVDAAFRNKIGSLHSYFPNATYPFSKGSPMEHPYVAYLFNPANKFPYDIGVDIFDWGDGEHIGEEFSTSGNGHLIEALKKAFAVAKKYRKGNLKIQSELMFDRRSLQITILDDYYDQDDLGGDELQTWIIIRLPNVNYEMLKGKKTIIKSSIGLIRYVASVVATSKKQKAPSENNLIEILDQFISKNTRTIDKYVGYESKHKVLKDKIILYGTTGARWDYDKRNYVSQEGIEFHESDEFPDTDMDEYSDGFRSWEKDQEKEALKDMGKLKTYLEGILKKNLKVEKIGWGIGEWGDYNIQISLA